MRAVTLHSFRDVYGQPPVDMKHKVIDWERFGIDMNVHTTRASPYDFPAFEHEKKEMIEKTKVSLCACMRVNLLIWLQQQATITSPGSGSGSGVPKKSKESAEKPKPAKGKEPSVKGQKPKEPSVKEPKPKRANQADDPDCSLSAH